VVDAGLLAQYAEFRDFRTRARGSRRSAPARRSAAPVVPTPDEVIDEAFVFFLGDNVVVGGIRQFVEKFRAQARGLSPGAGAGSEPQRFGVAEVRGDKIVGVVEKPKQPSEYAVTGIYLYGPPIFEAVRAFSPAREASWKSPTRTVPPGPRLPGRFSEITGWWKDTGKPEDLLEANRFALDHLLDGMAPVIRGHVDAESDVQGKVVVETGARVIASQIRGPAIIGKDAVIERSYVGPFTALGARCVIRNSELEYSILFEDTQILDADYAIERSLLGREVVIRRAVSRPRTQKFILADQSIIELC